MAFPSQVRVATVPLNDTPKSLGATAAGSLTVNVASSESIVLSGAVAYAGIRTGTKDSGFGSVVGWVVGVMGILGGLTTLAGLAGVALISPVVDEA